MTSLHRGGSTYRGECMRRLFWMALLDAPRLRRCTCDVCGRRHWNGKDICLPLCVTCFGNYLSER